MKKLTIVCILAVTFAVAAFAAQCAYCGASEYAEHSAGCVFAGPW